MRLFLAVIAVAALLAAACGGDDNRSSSEGDASATVEPTLPPVRPTPTPVSESFPVVEVTSPQGEFRPTAAEFRAIPTLDVDAKGKKTGVSLAELGARVKASPTTMVTIRGFSPDGRRDMFIRYPLAQVGSSSVLVIDGSGYLTLHSTAIPEAEWLTHIVSVSYP